MMPRTWKTLFAAATAVGLSGAAVAAPPMSAQTYVMKAGAGDQYELRSSKLVLASTHNPQIRDFAQKMIGDHTQSTQDVKAAALQSGLHPKPPMPDAKGRADLAALTRAHGHSRDVLYISQQKVSHQKALMLHQGYAQDGGKPALKAVATKVVPVVQAHIDMLNGMHA